MTSVYIASGIIILLISVLCYAFMIQTVAKKREQQQRMTQVLENRIKSFCILISGFPQGYLPKELNLLIYQQLIDATNQLIQLNAKESKYREELEVYSRELSEIQRRPPTSKRIKLESPKQSKEVKQYLTELNKFVHRLNKRGKLSNSEFDNYTTQIKQLVLYIAVDNYSAHAESAETADKPRMALHYYTLAKNLLAKEAKDKNMKTQIDMLDQHIARLQSITSEPEENESESGSETEDWDQFKSNTDTWKKKAIYD
jgi:chromosome segregation ATPase